MFERVFKRAFVIARHTSAPYADERARYLLHCLERGEKPVTVRQKAFELLWAARKFKRTYADLYLTKEEIEIVGKHSKARRRASNTPIRRRYRVQVVRLWIRFLGSLKRTPIPFEVWLNAYCLWARDERGLSETTITGRYEQVKHFLCWFEKRGRPLTAVSIDDVDAYLAYGAGERGWTRVSVYDVARGLRAFFRYGAAEGFTSKHLPELIRGPRVYAFPKAGDGKMSNAC